jgi:hypothetical protein
MLIKLWLFGALTLVCLYQLKAQTVSFNFTATAVTVSGWTNVVGDPSTAVRNVTSHGITVSSVAMANWSPQTGVAANNGVGTGGGTYFPAQVMSNVWFQYNGASRNLALYNAALPQLTLSGLNKDSTYTLKMSGSDAYHSASITQYTVAGATVASSQTLTMFHNTAQGVTFSNISPDAGGTIRIYVNATSASDYAIISGLQVFPGTAPVSAPIVAITAPANGTPISEGSNVTISATASETGGTIAKVEFYADSTKIGEVDAAPYTFTWIDPAPGNYQLTAKATDNGGSIATATVGIAVKSQNYFWSTTGNIATGGDTSFIGTVDSNRMAIRTKNIERMSILPTGNIGIGTIAPTAQLHTTGSVRLAGLTTDSTSNRFLVSDSSGNLHYRIATGGLPGISAGEGLGQSAGGIALGDSIPGPGPHSFASNRYQYLNGHFYSVGGSVYDPVSHPGIRVYNNGDIAAGTTMDAGVSTTRQSGFRYYAKLGLLQIGASDRLDTTVSQLVYGSYQGSGILINSDEVNSIKGRMYSSVIAGDGIGIDSGAVVFWSLAAGENLHFGGGTDHSLVVGFGHDLPVGLSDALITGGGNRITKPGSSVLSVSGYSNVAVDTARASLVGGSSNQFGGLSQLVTGNFLVNRSPYGVSLGSSNVDFTSLPYTGTQGVAVANIAQYPVLTVGNSADNAGAIRSNALTILYNGRTQINTTGFTHTLTQATVTPQAALDVVSTNSGVLLPRLTTVQRNAIVTADRLNGLLLYNTDSSAFQYYNGSAWNSIGAGSSGSASGPWQSSGSTGAIFDSLDNIAIGTSDSHGYKLAVNGAAIFSKIKVQATANWPDYVFRKGYRLPDLVSLERYLQKNNHLPGIPTAREMDADGLDVGAHQAALLKKVEELTLYLIRENKTLTTQDSQLKEQNQHISQQKQQLSEVNDLLEKQQKEIDELKALIKNINKASI